MNSKFYGRLIFEVARSVVLFIAAWFTVIVGTGYFTKQGGLVTWSSIGGCISGSVYLFIRGLPNWQRKQAEFEAILNRYDENTRAFIHRMERLNIAIDLGLGLLIVAGLFSVLYYDLFWHIQNVLHSSSGIKYVISAPSVSIMLPLIFILLCVIIPLSNALKNEWPVQNGRLGRIISK